MSTEWIQPGAPIAVYIDGRDGDRRLRMSKVKRVASKSFTVEDIKERFRLDTLNTKTIGGTYDNWRYVAVHPDSDEAMQVSERDRRDRAKTKVWRYLHNDADSLEQVDQAIQALTEWRTLLAPEVPQ